MTSLEKMLAESGLVATEQAELSELLAPLAAADVVPEPSPELAALLGEPTEGGAVDLRVSALRAGPRWRVRTATVGAVVLAVSGVGATGLSAAANTLPSAVQHHVSQFSRHYLPFEFPEPPERTDHPLGQGRFALAPEAIAPHGGDTTPFLGGVVGAVPPQAVVGSGRPSRVVRHGTPGLTGPDQEEAQTPGYGYAGPSASPSPSPSPDPADPSPSPSPDKPGGRPASLAPSPSPTPDASPDKGTGQGHAAGKPGKSQDAGTGKSPGKAPGKGTGVGSTTSGAGSGLGSLPVAGQGDDSAGEPAKPPPVPDPGGVLPELPDPGVLPEVPFAP